MSEYRTTATFQADGTFLIHMPGAPPEGTEAEVIVRYEEAPAEPKKTLEGFFRWLESQPPRESTWEAEQAMVRQLRDEWD